MSEEIPQITLKQVSKIIKDGGTVKLANSCNSDLLSSEKPYKGKCLCCKVEFENSEYSSWCERCRTIPINEREVDR